MQRLLLIHASNQSIRLGNCVIFMASSCSHSRVFSARKHNGLQIPKPVPPSFIKLATEFSYCFWQVLQYPPIYIQHQRLAFWLHVFVLNLTIPFPIEEALTTL